MAAISDYPRTPDVLYTSISSLMPIRLDYSNYTVWKYLMTTLFRAHNLIGYVDGTITAPEKCIPDAATGVPTEEISPLYETWATHDARVMVVIHATLSTTALNLIIGCHTARELWLNLEENCTSLTNFHVAKFRSDLQIATKGGDSVHAYVEKMEDIRSRLRGFDVVIDDAEMIANVMRGLPTEYNRFRAGVAARVGGGGEEALSLDGFYVMLLEEEEALRARNQYHFPQFADAQWSSNQCQICNAAGHIALVCPHRMDFTYQGVQQNQ